jgi:hypothetical protein
MGQHKSKSVVQNVNSCNVPKPEGEEPNEILRLAILGDRKCGKTKVVQSILKLTNANQNQNETYEKNKYFITKYIYGENKQIVKISQVNWWIDKQWAQRLLRKIVNGIPETVDSPYKNLDNVPSDDKYHISHAFMVLDPDAFLQEELEAKKRWGSEYKSWTHNQHAVRFARMYNELVIDLADLYENENDHKAVYRVYGNNKLQLNLTRYVIVGKECNNTTFTKITDALRCNGFPENFIFRNTDENIEKLLKYTCAKTNFDN